MLATSEPTTEQMARVLTPLWQLWQKYIAAMPEPARQQLAARVRFEAGRDEGLTTGDLDAMQSQIEAGQVDHCLAHYVSTLGV